MKKLLLVLALVFLLLPLKTLARTPDQITDWYIKDFQSEITVNQDSSLNITEKIVADCGDLPNKHGIFRVLPTTYYTEKNKVVKAPVKLISITDFAGNPYPYTTIKENDSITWKIGDANKTVTGVNNYKIVYQVKNVIRFDNPNFDEFYWNLNGNFWEIETDHFLGKIVFPAAIKSDDNTWLYSGGYQVKDGGIAKYNWISDREIQVESNQTLNSGEGITLSVTTSKGLFNPYIPGFWEKYGVDFFLIIPALIFILCFSLWQKYGRDPKISGTIVPEFAPPLKLTPMEMGGLIANGNLPSKYISAGIVNLAVLGHLKIEQLKGKNFKLERTTKSEEQLSDSEKILLEKIFGKNKEIETDDLKNKFYEDIPAIQTSVETKLESLAVYEPTNGCVMISLIGLTILMVILVFSLASFGAIPVLSFILSTIILIIFTILLPRRPRKGAEVMKQIEGFKLYMKTAEKYRQQFNEKENIFERFLPYAMVFGIVGLWTKAFAKIYAELHHQDYFSTYHPIWFIAASNQPFDADLFSSNLDHLTSNMSSTLSSAPSSSGSGGGGFSGGGGGGGGGGGW